MKSSLKGMSAAAVLLAGGFCPAAEPVAMEWQAEDGTLVRYRWAAPEKLEEGKRYPLVLFLHGAGERGTDNTAQIKHGVGPLLEGAAALGEATFLIAPQCPPGLWWAPPAEDRVRLAAPGGENPLLESVIELVAKLMAEHPVDPARFYVTGLSMGGFGTWDLLARVSPGRIAAAMPVCGGGDPESAEKFKDVPVWAFHGEDDQVVPVAATRKMIDALEKAGGKPKVTIYPGVQHDSWTATYADKEAIRWMFSQARPQP
jgi:predicted peptidase